MRHPVASTLVAGFLAGAIGIVAGHQLVILLLGGNAYSLAPVPPWGVPRLVNSMFWGGLWGALMALVWTRLPPVPAPLRGALFAILFPLLVGSWLIVASLRGQKLLVGLDPTAMGRGILIYAVWGAVMGVLFPLLATLLRETRAAR